MKYLDEYRDAEGCRQLLKQTRRDASRCWTIMEVCGGQTHALLRNGIDAELEGVVRLIHGPGCPVCVTPLESIDFAIELAGRPDVVLTSFGDMLRVPGSQKSLLRLRAEGGNVQVVYSPLDAVQLAQKQPDRQVVFFAVGFETTTPATALAVHQARRLELKNFSLLVSHVRVQPAMEMLTANPDNAIDGFLAAGHVCTVAGFDSYEQFTRDTNVPVVVTGFEPLDLLWGIWECVRLLEAGTPEVSNRYARSAKSAGNRRARELVDEVYEICDRPWRGLGVVPKGGVRLRELWSEFDAERRFPFSAESVSEPAECRSGEILTGRIKPPECECFGNRCTPESPLGAPMVSAEGACAAYYRYAANRMEKATTEEEV
jgi:hydrogenase expression/formation protein HypD